MRSVIDQDYPAKEYIVMDGGSTDHSVDVIRRHEANVAYWCSERDEGQADAIRKGFARCTGDVLCWLNSDDYYLPGALTRVARYFQANPEVEAVSAGGCFVNEDGRLRNRGWGTITRGVAATYDRLRFYAMDGVLQQSTFWRRSAYEAVGGIDPSLYFVLDLDLFIRLAERRPFGRLPFFAGCFRLHDDCKTMTSQDVRHTELKALRERYGVAVLSTFQQRLLYWRYRLPSLARKLDLWLRHHFGSVPCPSLPTRKT